MVQGIHRPDPNRSCLQVCHRSLTVSHSRVLGSSSSQAGVTGRTLTAGPGVEETCEKPVREGIHRPDPNPSCMTGFSKVSHSFLTAESWGFPAATPRAGSGLRLSPSSSAGPKLHSRNPRSNLLRLHLCRHRAIVGQIRPNIAEIPEPTRSLKSSNPDLKLLFIQQGEGSRSNKTTQNLTSKWHTGPTA